jgi:hypothetical protein
MQDKYKRPRLDHVALPEGNSMTRRDAKGRRPLMQAVININSPLTHIYRQIRVSTRHAEITNMAVQRR